MGGALTYNLRVLIIVALAMVSALAAAIPSHDKNRLSEGSVGPGFVLPGASQLRFHTNDKYGECVGTFIGSNPYGDGTCLFGIATAAHCYHIGLRNGLRSIEMPFLGNLPLASSLPPERQKTSTNVAWVQDGSKADPPADVAIVYARSACNLVAPNLITPLAPLNAANEPDISAGEQVYTCKHDGTSVCGTVQSASVGASLGENFRALSTGDSAGFVYYGDSGTPIWNSRGEFIAPLSGGSGQENLDPQKRGTRDFSFARAALKWTHEQYNKFLRNSGTPESAPSQLTSTASLAGATVESVASKAQSRSASVPSTQLAMANPTGSTFQPSLQSPSRAPSSFSVAPATQSFGDLSGLTFDATSQTPQHSFSFAQKPQEPALDGPGDAVPTLRRIRQDFEGEAYVLLKDKTWSKVKLNEDSTITSDTGTELDQDALKELLLAYDASRDSAALYGEKATLIIRALDKYADKISKWKHEAAEEKRLLEEQQHIAIHGPPHSGNSDNVPGSIANLGGGGAQLASAQGPFQSTSQQGAQGASQGPRGTAGSFPFCTDNNYSRADIDRYESLQYIVDGKSLGYRERFQSPLSRNMFSDLPNPSQPKIVLAYFGSSKRTDLEQALANNPLVEARHYAPGTEEYNYATRSGFQALGVDGLGRKITRYSTDASDALRDLLKNEAPMWARYLCAKNPRPTSFGQAFASVPSTGPLSGGSNPISFQSREPASTGPGSIPAGAMEKCASCHNAEKNRHPLLAQANLLSSDGVRRAVASGRVSESVLEGMFLRMKAKPETDITEADKDELRSFVRSAGGGTSPYSSIVPASSPRVQLMSAGEQAQLARLPQMTGSTGNWLSRYMPGATFYTHKESPRLGQHHEGGEQRVYNTDTAGAFAVSDISQGNGNRQFPWKQSGGTDNVVNEGSSYKFFIPPAHGPMLAVSDLAKYTGRQVDVPYRTGGTIRTAELNPLGAMHHGNVDEAALHAAAVQPGTVSGEVLTVSNGSKSFPFEIRLRTMTAQGWKYDVLRPFADADELVAAVRAASEWQSDPQVQAFLATMAQNPASTIHTSDMRKAVAPKIQRTNSETEALLDGSEAEDKVMQREALAQNLPPLPPALVEKLLTETPFKSVFGRPWVKTQTGEGWAPVAKGFHIVPEGYMGHHIPMTVRGCTSCHNATLRHVDHRDPPLGRMGELGYPHSQGSRDWYGNFRGTLQQAVADAPGLSAGNFSLPIFNPNAPSRGDAFGGRKAEANPQLERAGLIQWVSRQR